ncbi:MAG: hypothetical protein PHN35_01955 [Clostridia bacterium]|nr:hypothetical protein [Clostridia bacterium]MDD4798699.1 hypothetical protein [Clostridia bacterium]
MCETCGCQSHHGDHHHTSLSLPVEGLKDNEKAEKIVKNALKAIGGLHDIEPDAETGTVSFLIHEESSLSEVKKVLDGLKL